MSDKQFPPSIKRLEKARKDGKTIKSRLVNICVAWWMLTFALKPSLSWVREGTLIQWMNYKVWTPQVALTQALWEVLKISGLLVGVLALSGIAVSLAQTKGLFLPTQVLKGLNQYKPGAYFGKVKQGVVDANLGFIRCCVVVVLVSPFVVTFMTVHPPMTQFGAQEVFRAYWQFIQSELTHGGVAFTLIAVVAYSWARWRFYRQMRMSLQELKDEHKEDEGDPHVKHHRKNEHRAMLFSEVEKRVKNSKVVVVSRAGGGSS